MTGAGLIRLQQRIEKDPATARRVLESLSKTPGARILIARMGPAWRTDDEVAVLCAMEIIHHIRRVSQVLRETLP